GVRSSCRHGRSTRPALRPLPDAEVLVADEPGGLVEARREPRAPAGLEVIGGVERGALVERRAVGVDAEEARLGEARAVPGREAREPGGERRRDRRRDQQASGPQDSADLVEPRELLLLG